MQLPAHCVTVLPAMRLWVTTVPGSAYTEIAFKHNRTSYCRQSYGVPGVSVLQQGPTRMQYPPE